MKMRLFVAINLDEKIKADLVQRIESIRGRMPFTARFVKPENMHLTVTFLGYQDEEAVSRILEAIRKVASDFEGPIVELRSITYAPIKEISKSSRVRMIWLNASRETSNKLAVVKTRLEENLFERGVRFRKESRQFNVHLTLARFEEIRSENLPPLEINFKQEFQAESLDLMQSHLRRTGAEYVLLSKFAFRGKLY